LLVVAGCHLHEVRDIGGKYTAEEENANKIFKKSAQRIFSILYQIIKQVFIKNRLLGCVKLASYSTFFK